MSDGNDNDDETPLSDRDQVEETDKLSDPKNPYTLQFEHVVEAAATLKSKIPVTPCIPSNHQKKFVVKVYYKLESLQATGSFKERGMLFTLLKLIEKENLKSKDPHQNPTQKGNQKKTIDKPVPESISRVPIKGVVVASVGNQALSLCYHARKLKIPVVVVMASDVPIVRAQRCRNLKAKILIRGENFEQAKQYARAFALQNGLEYIDGRDHPDALAGHGTVALEILDQVPTVDAVLVPTGSGGLLAAVGTVVKRCKPDCLVYGVGPDAMPAVITSLTSKRLRKVPLEPTIADNIAMTTAGVNAFCTLKPLVDKMVPVSEEGIARAILHMYEAERLVVEGAGACPLAAIYDCAVPELLTKTVVCIVSGGNIDTVVLTRCLDIGRAAENRLVQFRVKIIDRSSELTGLLQLLHKGGFSLYRHFRHGQWIEGGQQLVEMELVVETKGLEHTQDLIAYINAAYPARVTLQDDPPLKNCINCACYVKK